jgi:hypothetical protein
MADLKITLLLHYRHEKRKKKRAVELSHGNVDMPCPREPSTRHFLAWVLLEITETQRVTGTVNDGGGELTSSSVA